MPLSPKHDDSLRASASYAHSGVKCTPVASNVLAVHFCSVAVPPKISLCDKRMYVSSFSASAAASSSAAFELLATRSQLSTVPAGHAQLYILHVSGRLLFVIPTRCPLCGGHSRRQAQLASDHPNDHKNCREHGFATVSEPKTNARRASLFALCKPHQLSQTLKLGQVPTVIDNDHVVFFKLMANPRVLMILHTWHTTVTNSPNNDLEDSSARLRTPSCVTRARVTVLRADGKFTNVVLDSAN